MRRITICLLTWALCAGSVFAQGAEAPAQEGPSIFDQVFAALYPDWQQMGGQYAQVFEANQCTVRLLYEVAVSAEGGAVRSLSVNVPLPPNTPRQRIHSLQPSQEQYTLQKIGDSQHAISFELTDLEPGTVLTIGWEAQIETARIHHPMEILEQCTRMDMIPAWIITQYTGDEEVYSINHPVIQEAAAIVRQQAGTLPEAVWATYNLVSSAITYDHASADEQWATASDEDMTAPEALANGTGVCRHYTYAMIAICRALGIPARMCAGFHLMGESLHGWPEIYFPEYGWVSMDPTFGKAAPDLRASCFGTLGHEIVLTTVGYQESGLATRSRYLSASDEMPAIVGVRARPAVATQG